MDRSQGISLFVVCVLVDSLPACPASMAEYYAVLSIFPGLGGLAQLSRDSCIGTIESVVKKNYPVHSNNQQMYAVACNLRSISLSSAEGQGKARGGEAR